jgi:cyclic beta-1,2-glucan synthetase
LNPINHASTQADAERYKVEPYVAVADIYSVAPHVGRGGWTWYTGSAGLMYRAGIEGILGIRREGAWLVIEPCIPSSWPGFRAAVNVAGTHYRLRVEALPQDKPYAYEVRLDGVTIDAPPGPIRVALDGGAHTLDLGSRQQVELADAAAG